MKISVVMIDGSFRENVFGARYFTEQDFPDSDYEVIWVEYFDKAHPEVVANERVKTVCLGRKDIYHSSVCFNAGIAAAKGDVICLPDADQIVPPDFLGRVHDAHCKYEKLVLYGYRYDEPEKGDLQSRDLEELEEKCILKNPTNYGGCLTVRKRWLQELNGYEQHPVFRSGNHANGLDMYTRFKNYGLAIQWEPTLKLYHPWHPFTLEHTSEHDAQEKIIAWRRQNAHWLAFEGMDAAHDKAPPERAAKLLDRQMKRLEKEAQELDQKKSQAVAAGAGSGFLRRVLRSWKKA